MRRNDTFYETFCYFLFFLLGILPCLIAFEPRQITTAPTVGFQETPFFDSINNLDRTLSIWYPVDQNTMGAASSNPWDLFMVAENAPILDSLTKKPVVILSHGWKGNPHQLSWLIRGLVHDGFIVIGIQHRDFIKGKLHINHWLRARDLQIALDQFESTSFSAYADYDRIGVAGFSLGGTTSLLVSGGRFSDQKSLIPPPEFVYEQDFSNIESALPDLDKSMMTSEWLDRRIQAAFVIAPTWSWLFEEKSLNQIAIPIYLVASSGDKVIATAHNAGLFARTIPNVIYQEIPGQGGHYIFLSSVTESAQKQIDPTGMLHFLFEDDVQIDRTALQWQLAEEAVRFFREVL